MALVSRAGRLAVLPVAVLLLVACAPWQPTSQSAPRTRPPVQQRVITTPPAWYRVQRGETLYSIAFRYGLDWRNVARWNTIDAPYVIRPGQELRMRAPTPPPSTGRSGRSGSNTASTSRAAGRQDKPTPPDPKPEPKPKPEPGPKPKPSPQPEPKPPPAESRSEPTQPEAAASASSATRTVGGVIWQWPTRGRLARAFDPADTRKGIGVAGSAGQDVVAAAQGRVVYSGTALIGYGELIIIKHSDQLLSAYGHNRRRLVAEGDGVQRGQKIAEMGENDRQEEMLHFEIRKNGEPVNPRDYLPKQ